MRYFKVLSLILMVLLVAASLLMISCSSSQSTPSSTTNASTTVSNDAIKIGFNEGFTGFMAMDATTTEHGILTALAEANNSVLGRPVKYIKVDNGSDAVAAVDKARQLVESDKIDVMFGPIFSPAAQAVTDYLAKSGGTPNISIFGQAHDNLQTANNLLVIPAGMHSFQGWIMGRYASDKLGYKTANIINFEESTGHDMAEGFTKGFGEKGGTIVSEQFVPEDAIDFSSYITTLKKADCTVFWIFGQAAGPFIKEYHDYGIKAPLLLLMADNVQEPVLKDLGDISLGILATDHYIPLIDNPINAKFVADYTKQWDGEQPNMDSFGGWVAVNLFLEAVKKTNGDTSHQAIINALSNITIDTPTGPYTLSSYQNAFIGTGNFYIAKSVNIDGRYTWQPVYTYNQVRFEDHR
jgi:branched-chain amino acid transport system substrate-binding protein